MKRYLRRIAVSIDQLGNTIAGGHPDETISSRVGRSALRGDPTGLFLEKIINRLAVWLGDEPNHCRRMIERKCPGA
jgi:hypothetical protein